MMFSRWSCCLVFFFFNDTATTEIYTLSLHDALPILIVRHVEIRLEVVQVHPVDRDVRGSLAMWRVLDGVDAPSWRQILRRDVFPRLAVVSRHPHGTVVRSGPEDSRFEP